jgi:hypothetical protein
MSKLYRQHCREQEVYSGKDFQKDFSAAREPENKQGNTCEKCKDTRDFTLWCDECIKRELDTMEEYYREEVDF